MGKIRKLHNKTLYKVKLHVTKEYTLYMDAKTQSELDKEVMSVVDGDMYEMATHYKPPVVNYSYIPEYITCEQSYEDFMNEQED